MNAESIRAFLLKLPHVVETTQWTGKLAFWVGDKAIGGKIFVMLNLDGNGKAVLSYSAGPERYSELLEIEGLFPAPYMARIWWIAAERWDVFRSRQWEQELQNAYDLTLRKLAPGAQKALRLSPKELRLLVVERRKLLETRTAAQKSAKPPQDSRRTTHGMSAGKRR